MAPERMGIVIGAVFGLIYVLVNAAELPAPVGLLLQVLGVVAFLAVLVRLRRAGTASARQRAGTGGFSRGYWLGAGIAVFGALGLVVASAGASDAAIAAIAGVCPGALLLGGSVWAARSSGADRSMPYFVPPMGPHSVHQIAALDLARVNPVTGPVPVKGAAPGDVRASVACDLRIHEVVDAPNRVVGCFVPDALFDA